MTIRTILQNGEHPTKPEEKHHVLVLAAVHLLQVFNLTALVVNSGKTGRREKTDDHNQQRSRFDVRYLC